jgi:hypothetical protein
MLAVRTHVAAAASLCATLAASCGGERWVISEAFETPDAALGLDAAGATSCTAQPIEGIPREPSTPLLGPGHAGRWLALLSGEEAGKFPSDRLLLSLSETGARLRLEASSPLPPLLDGRGGYLCHAPGASTCASESGFVPGFEYPLSGVRARGSIVSFRVFLEQPWDEWCQLQAPLEQDPAGCDPRYAVEAPYSDVRWGEPCAARRGEDWFDLDCDRLATLEHHACVCSADGCRGADRALQLNLRLVAPDTLAGALWFAPDRAQVLHFERQPSTGTP